MLNKAASERGLGCTNTHIWAAGWSWAAELPHSWPAAPDLLDKGSFSFLLGNLGLWRVQPLPNPPRDNVWLPPVVFFGTGTLTLTAFPAEGMPLFSL